MYLRNGPERIHQGDIIEQLVYKFLSYKDDKIDISIFTFPYAIVLSQECDLEQDYKARCGLNGASGHDKYLNSLLICPAYLATELHSGTHLSELGYTMQSWSTEQWKIIKQNNNDRFHFLDEDLEKGLPNLVVDFKHYYTLTRDDIYQVFAKNYKISLKELYRERLSQRFANYLARIGLPEPTVIQPPAITQTPTV